MGVAPPPPPNGVPKLTGVHGVETPVSMRERMAQHLHIADPTCAGCHKLMDPAGFAMENYDAIGRWRTHESGKEIDASGGLPDGSVFTGIGGLQKALMARPETFVGAMTEKLMTYSVGRGVTYADAPAIRKIVRDSRAGGYQFSSLVLGIVNSAPFQMRRTQ